MTRDTFLKVCKAMIIVTSTIFALPAVSSTRPSLEKQDAGPQIVMSLADAIFLGLRNNRDVRSAYIDRVAQRFDLRVSEDVFTPHLSLSGQALKQRSGSVSSNDLILSPTANLLTPTGAQFNFSWDNERNDVSGILARSSAATISVTQPLARGGGLAVNMAPVKTARLSEEINKATLRATIATTITSIISAYRDLLQAQAMKVLADDAVAHAQDLVRIDHEMIEAGRMADVEVVQAEADFENQKVQALQAEGQITSSRLALLSLLDLDLSTRIITRDSEEPHAFHPDFKSAMRLALTHRPDYLSQLNVIEQRRLGIVVAENQTLWDVALVANARLGRQVTTGINLPKTGYRIGDSTVGVRLNIPINDLTPEQGLVHANASLQDAEIQLASLRQGAEAQIRSTIQDLDLKWRQIESARRARALASRAIQIEKEKLAAGRSSTFQVRSIEADFRAAAAQELSIVIGYLNATTVLDLQLGTTLETWKVDLRDQ